MNINVLKIFKETLVFFIIGLFLTYRYIDIGIDKTQVLFFGAYYFFAVLVFIFSRIRFNNPINPISIFVPFIFLLSYSFMQISYDQEAYSLNTLIVINLSIVTYLIFASLDFPYKPVKLVRIDAHFKLKFLRFIILMAFVTFCLECLMFGYVPILNITSMDVYNDSTGKLIPFLHYFILLNAFIPSWSYIYFKDKLISKKELTIIMLISVFILLNYLSKQMYLLFGMSFFISYSFYNDLKIKNLIKAVSALLLAFLFIGYLRLDSETSFSAGELYRAYAGIKNENISVIESFFVLYSSVRFTVLNEMINFSDNINYLACGVYTFRPLTSLILLEKTGIIQRIPELDSEVRVGTYLIDPYLDYSFFGVFILNAFYGFLALRYYKQYKDRYPEAIVKFSIIIFCLLMGMFVNYFNSMLIWIGLLFNKLLIGGINRKKSYL